MLRDTIAQCKSVLPMPELWQRLGLEIPRGFPKSFCSVFREDHSASASVFQVGRCWFYKDHATGESFDEIGLIQRHTGCEKGDAIKSYHELAGIGMESRKSEQRGATRRDMGKVVAIYDYRDATEKLVHQTLRWEPKAFTQRRPAADGMRVGNKRAWRDPHGDWWISTLEGIEPVLYRLPELIADARKPVVICEGEKDADAMAAWCSDFASTTNAMGAGKWRPSYTAALAGRDIIIAGDRDEAGRRHMIVVAEQLRPVAASVKLVNWGKLAVGISVPSDQKIDIADFVAAAEHVAA